MVRFSWRISHFNFLGVEVARAIKMNEVINFKNVISSENVKFLSKTPLIQKGDSVLESADMCRLGD